MHITLRDYQIRDIDRIREAFTSYDSVLYTLPTGGGKTVIFSYITESAAKKGNPVCIVVHRQELVMQTSIQLASLGIPHNIITQTKVIRQARLAQLQEFGKVFIDPTAIVLVASVQTLANRLNHLKKIKFLIIDECHHTAAGSWGKVVTCAKPCKVLGVTATPLRMDGKGLRHFFDHIVIGQTVRQLIENGYLSKPRVFAPAITPDLSGIRVKGSDYDEQELSDLMDKASITGDAVAHYKKLCNGLPALAFCVSIKHAEHVAEIFREAGITAMCISGKDTTEKRVRSINDLASGKIQVLTSCNIISEGTDIPVVTSSILLRPTKSLALYLQQVGRCLRPYPGKECAYILDHAGNTRRHGMPQEERRWALEYDKVKASKRKNQDYLNIVQCPVCYAMHMKAPQCPECLHIYDNSRKIDQKDGELVELEWAPGKDIKAAKLKELLPLARDREKLQQIARIKGYNPKWVEHIMASRGRGKYVSRKKDDA